MSPISPAHDFIQQRRIAVVGASNDRGKYGNIAFRDLLKKGYTVYAVNPREKTIEGAPCYANLAALPEPVDGVVTVVPPHVTEQIVREAAAAGIKRVWMQEGSESPEAIALCEKNGISVVHDQCIMVVTNYRGMKWEEG